MKKLINISFALIFSIQLISGSDITGKIIDSGNQAPMEFVSIILKEKGETKISSSTKTDSMGKFKLTDVKNGSYELQISFIGYKTTIKKILVSGSNLSLGNIAFSEDSKVLSGVEVVGQTAQMKLEIDKKIFNVDQNITASGGSASDVLKNIPSVQVDNDGNVSLRKDSNVEVWINGKPAGLTTDNRAQILQQMPAENIQSIEVINNPSAKFSPEGTAGIINIVMKKNKRTGYYGSASAGVFNTFGAPSTPNLGASINYSNAKIDSYVNIGYRGMAFKGTTNTKRYTFDILNQSDTLSALSIRNSTLNIFSGLFARASVDYHIDSLSTIGFSGFAMGGSGRSIIDNDYSIIDYQSQNSILYQRESNGNISRPSYNLNLDYKRALDTRGSNISSTIGYSESERGGLTTVTQEGPIKKEQSSIKMNLTSTSKDFNVKSDYTKIFNKNSKLEAGWQSTFSQRISESSAYNNLLSMPIDTYNYNFDYYEQIHAGYLTFGSQLNKFNFQGGLRAEYLNKSWSLTSSNPTVDSHYKPVLQVFPSLFVGYSLEDKNEVQLNISRRINRPRGRQLSPFKDLSDSTNISYGNPVLDPEYATFFEFNYLKYWNTQSISASIFHKKVENGIQSVRFMNGSIMESTYMNITKLMNSGLEMISKNQLNKIINLTSTINCYFSKMDSARFINPYQPTTSIKIQQQKIFTWSGNLMANFLLNKTLSGQVTAQYNSPSIVAQGIQSPQYAIDLGLRKSFLQKKLNISLIIADIFNLRQNKTTLSGITFKQTSTSYFHRRMIGLTANYNFGNINPKSNEMKKKNSGSEMNMDMGE